MSGMSSIKVKHEPLQQKNNMHLLMITLVLYYINEIKKKGVNKNLSRSFFPLL